MGLAIRVGRDHFRADNLVFYRSLIQTLMLAPWAGAIFSSGANRRNQVPVYRLHLWRFHFFRGLFGILSMVSIYSAIQRLPLALATLLGMTGVVWGSIFSAVFLKERVSRTQVIGGVVAATGLLLVVVPTDVTSLWTYDTVGIGLGLFSGLFMGAAHTLIRKMRVDGTSMQEIVFYFGITGMVLTLPGLIAHPQFPETSEHWITLFVVGIVGSLGQMVMTVGFRYAKTAVASLCILAQTPINIGLGAWWLSEHPPTLFYLGMALVFVGIARVVIVKQGNQ